MTKDKKKAINFGLILGVIGTLAGIFLIVQGNYFLGVSGGIARIGLTIISYKTTKF